LYCKLLSLILYLLQLTIVYLIGCLNTYLLFILQFFYIKYEQLIGKVTSIRLQKGFKEVNYFYTQIMPIFFFNLRKERLLTINGIIITYSRLPTTIKVLMKLFFITLILYYILVLINIFYYFIFLH
jgi:hypothetical protein